MSRLIDWQLLDAISEGWSSEFLAIFAEFAAEIQTGWDELFQLVQKEDWEAVLRQAHKLKGSAANFGFEGLREQALAIEEALQSGRTPLVPEMVETGRDRLLESLREAEQLKRPSS